MLARQLEGLLRDHGFVHDRTSGSHRIYVKKGFPPISVPYHAGKDIKPGTLKNILKTAGIKCNT